MLMHAHTTIPPVDGDSFQRSCCSQGSGESRESSCGAAGCCQEEADPGALGCPGPGPGVGIATNRNECADLLPVQTHWKNTPLEDIHGFSTLNMILKQGPIVEGVFGEPGLFFTRSWLSSLASLDFSQSYWMSHYSPMLTAFSCKKKSFFFLAHGSVKISQKTPSIFRCTITNWDPENVSGEQ